MSSVVYAIYKIAKIGAYPLTWILGLQVLALIALWRGRRRWLQACLVAAFLLTYALSLPPVARWLAWSLEHRYASPVRVDPPPTTPPYDAVVVLAGGVSRQGGLRREDRLRSASLDRLLCGRSLMGQGVAPRLVFSGGNADPFADLTPEAEIMARTLQSLGSVPWRVQTETRSRTTYENAVEIKQALGTRARIALVTSALHMPRAMALFRHQGLDVTAFPCEYATGAPLAGVREYLPDVGELWLSTKAVNEWVGLWLYSVAGKTGGA